MMVRESIKQPTYEEVVAALNALDIQYFHFFTVQDPYCYLTGKMEYIKGCSDWLLHLTILLNWLDYGRRFAPEPFFETIDGVKSDPDFSEYIELYAGFFGEIDNDYVIDFAGRGTKILRMYNSCGYRKALEIAKAKKTDLNGLKFQLDNLHGICEYFIKYGGVSLILKQIFEVKYILESSPLCVGELYALLAEIQISFDLYKSVEKNSGIFEGGVSSFERLLGIKTP